MNQSRGTAVQFSTPSVSFMGAVPPFLLSYAPAMASATDKSLYSLVETRKPCKAQTEILPLIPQRSSYPYAPSNGTEDKPLFSSFLPHYHILLSILSSKQP
ncbi:hypothetical protein Anapl_08847 [Anas platyrhynchos]|uniref:Uncharacterized protein n=1 Tax=Anas platyrhynchos TaxID=8839 RepID=R0JP27_ANAPL|nr:hypothetical protein Anapl_08847 [Anas platyrhynchos]